MFLLLTGSRGTACAKFVVLIVSVVGAEIELDLGPISYTRQRISQERCRKCPLWVKSRHMRCTDEEAEGKPKGNGTAAEKVIRGSGSIQVRQA
jgi:hypothetical protein